MNTLPFRPRVRVLSLCGLLVLVGALAFAWAPWRSTLQAQGKEEGPGEKAVNHELQALKAVFKGAVVTVNVSDLPPNQTVHYGSVVDVREILGRRFLVLENRGDPRAPRRVGVPQTVTVSYIDCNRIASISQSQAR